MTLLALEFEDSDFHIRFQSSLLHDWVATFPCDADGNVDIDRLSETDRSEYLFGRIMTRRECLRPEVVPLLARRAR
jgi:hypothetical protein